MGRCSRIPDADRQMPACFDSREDWMAWRHYARATGVVSVCHDCTRAYRDQMIQEDRCQHPETIIATQETGSGTEIIGFNRHTAPWHGLATGQSHRTIIADCSDDAKAALLGRRFRRTQGAAA